MSKQRTTVALCDKWNKATCPYALRTDHEHHRNQQWARAIMNRLTSGGHHFKYLTSGAVWPVNPTDISPQQTTSDGSIPE